jgi:hypothetical protein
VRYFINMHCLSHYTTTCQFQVIQVCSLSLFSAKKFSKKSYSTNGISHAAGEKLICCVLVIRMTVTSDESSAEGSCSFKSVL